MKYAGPENGNTAEFLIEARKSKIKPKTNTKAKKMSRKQFGSRAKQSEARRRELGTNQRNQMDKLRRRERERARGSRDDDDEDESKAWGKGRRREQGGKKPKLTMPAIKMALGLVHQKTSKNARKLRY